MAEKPTSEQRLDDCRRWQESFWDYAGLLFPKLPMFIYGTTLAVLLGVLGTLFGISFYNIIFKNDDSFLFAVVESLPVRSVIWILKTYINHPAIMSIVLLLIIGVIWLIGYLIMIHLFPKVQWLKSETESRVMENITDDNDNIIGVKLVEHDREPMGKLGRMFYIDDPELFWIARWGDRLEKIYWLIMGVKWQPPTWRDKWHIDKDGQIDWKKSRREIQVINSNTSIFRMCVGLYDSDKIYYQRLFFKNYKAGLREVQIEAGPKMEKGKAEYMQFENDENVDLDRHFKRETKKYKRSTLKIIDNTEKMMDSSTALNPSIAYRERQDSVIRKKRPEDKAREEKELENEHNRKKTLERLKREYKGLE